MRLSQKRLAVYDGAPSLARKMKLPTHDDRLEQWRALNRGRRGSKTHHYFLVRDAEQFGVIECVYASDGSCDLLVNRWWARQVDEGEARRILDDVTAGNTFCNMLQLGDIGGYVREYRFDIQRRWRFDFAWPSQKLAVEIEGGVWSRGRHTRGAGYVADLEKYNAATLLGWQVLRYDVTLIESGLALHQVGRALGLVTSR
jgi:very-short-patch-repair endonuclease